MNTPRVSIILPVYNAETYVAGAINSVLQQSFDNFELIIINDGSTDKSDKIIKDYSDQRIKILNNSENLGIQKTLNRGLNLTCGEYIARIDADDEWIDIDKLKKQIDFLDNNQDYILIGTGAMVIDENGKELFCYLNNQADNKIRSIILSKNQFLHSSVVFRANAVKQINGYNEDIEFKHVEDYDLWLRSGKLGKFYNLPNYSIKYRQSGKQVSAINRIKQIKSNLFLIKKYQKYYPNYFISVIRIYLRLIIYGYLNLSCFKKITAQF